MTDKQALFSNVHHLKGNMDDYRLQIEVLAIRQSIEVDKIAQELRYCLSEENIADCLTKISRTSHLLMNVIKTGVFNPPDGTTVRDSTMNAVHTWGQLMQAEAQVKTTNKSRDIVIMEVDIVHYFFMLNETSAELLRMVVMMKAGR